MPATVSLDDAKIDFSKLVDSAIEGEEIVITRNGVALAKLVSIPVRWRRRRPANALALTYIADDFDAPLPASANQRKK
jgi:prevent-host-death family protein